MKSGEDINLELQIGPYSYMEKRMMFYWSKIYSGKLKSEEEKWIIKKLLQTKLQK